MNNWLSLNELTIKYDAIIERMEFLIASNNECKSTRRWEHKQYKKNKRSIKYKIFKNRTSLEPSNDIINNLKASLVLLEEEERESFSRLSDSYVMHVRNMEYCYGERLDLETCMKKKRNRA